MTISRAAQTSRGLILPAIPASCQFWYTCFENTLSGSALLTSLRDVSVAQSVIGNTGPSRPAFTLATSGWGSKPTLTADGGNGGQTAGSQLIGVNENLTTIIARDLQGSSNDFTIFAAVQPNASQIANPAVLFSSQNNTPNSNVTLETVGTNGATLVCTYYDSTPTLTTSSTATLSTSAPNIVEAVKNGTSLDIYVDGVKQGATVTGVDAMNKSTSNIRLFRRDNASPRRFWGGGFGGAVYCNSALGTTTRNAIRAWLANNYAHPVTQSTAFDPSDVAPLALWFDGDTGTSVATGVKQWNDRSGNGHHLTQATGGQQPALITNAINGHTAIRFDGVDDILTTANFTLDQPATYFIVFKLVTLATPVANDTVFGGTTDFIALICDSAETYMFAGAVLSHPHLAAGSYNYLTCLFNSTSSAFWENGVQVVAGDVGTHGAGGFSIGGGVALGARNTNVEVAEILVYPSALTAGQITTVEAYLKTKYAL